MTKTSSPTLILLLIVECASCSRSSATSPTSQTTTDHYTAAACSGSKTGPNYSQLDEYGYPPCYIDYVFKRGSIHIDFVQILDTSMDFTQAEISTLVSALNTVTDQDLLDANIHVVIPSGPRSDLPGCSFAVTRGSGSASATAGIGIIFTAPAASRTLDPQLGSMFLRTLAVPSSTVDLKYDRPAGNPVKLMHGPDPSYDFTSKEKASLVQALDKLTDADLAGAARFRRIYPVRGAQEFMMVPEDLCHGGTDALDVAFGLPSSSRPLYSNLNEQFLISMGCNSGFVACNRQ
jgi:hypothetical protein